MMFSTVFLDWEGKRMRHKDISLEAVDGRCMGREDLSRGVG